MFENEKYKVTIINSTTGIIEAYRLACDVYQITQTASDPEVYIAFTITVNPSKEKLFRDLALSNCNDFKFELDNGDSNYINGKLIY